MYVGVCFVFGIVGNFSNLTGGGSVPWKQEI